MIVAPRKVKGSCGNIRVWIVLLLNWQTRGPTGFKNILSNRTSTADLISLSFYSLCWNVINTVCVSVCVCALPCLVRHAGRKLLVQGKERSWADGQPAHRLSCSQELISLSPTPWVARNTHTHTHALTARQLDTAEDGVRDLVVELWAGGTLPLLHRLLVPLPTLKTLTVKMAGNKEHC